MRHNSPAARTPDAEIYEEPSMRIFVPDSAQAERAAEVLVRAGFKVADATPSPTGDPSLRAVERKPDFPDVAPSGPERTAHRSHAHLALRVTQAADRLDDPTTSLMANLETLKADLAGQSFDPSDAREMVSDCVSAVHTLLEGIECLKAVAAPPVQDERGATSLDLVLRDAVLRHRRRSTVPVSVPRVLGMQVGGGRLALGQVIADVLELLTSRPYAGPRARIEVSTVRDGEAVRVVVADDGPALDDHFSALLTGEAPAHTFEELALVEAAAHLHYAGGAVWVSREVPGACVELRLPPGSAQS